MLNRRRFAGLLLALLFVCAPSAFASWETRGIVFGRSLGVAVHTPNVATTLASTPDAGVTLPAGTVSIIMRVETNPIRYFHSTTVAPTAALGIKLDPGVYAIINDPRLISTLKFIDTAAGPSSVTFEFYGETP